MKRSLSLIWMMVMLVGLLPANALAAETTEATEATEPAEFVEFSSPEAEVTHEHEHTAVVTASACNGQGYTTHTCECGDSCVDRYTAPTGEHSCASGVCSGIDLDGSEDPVSSAWPMLNTDLTHIICYGQSFSVGADAPGYADPIVDGTYVMGAITGSKNGDILKPLQMTYGSQHPIVTAVNSLSQMLTAAGIDTDIIAGSYGSGGRTIAQLMSAERQQQIKEEEGYDYDCLSAGTYQVFQNSVAAIAGYAGDTCRSVSCPAIVYLQGETDQNTDAQLGYPDNPVRAGYGAGGDKEKYKEYMTRLKEDMQQEVMGAYGQTEKPLFLIYQVSGTYVRTQYSSINMAQIEFAQENNDVILVQTPYFSPHYTNSHHLTVNGYRWLGEYIGQSIYTALTQRTKTWPMLPQKFTVEDAKTIRITVSGAVDGLTVDTWTVEDATNGSNKYGFYLVMDATRVVPKTVAVDGNDIILTLPNDVNDAGSAYVYYGGQGAKGTGNIRDNCAKTGFYCYLDDGADTGTENNQGVSHSAMDKDGNSMIGQPYPLYNWLASFCYEIEVPGPEQKKAATYYWEMQETGMVCIMQGKAEENNLTLLQGSVGNGILQKVQYSIEKPLVLYHDRPWFIEWKAEGNGSSYGGGKILSASQNGGSKVRYLYMPADSRGFLAWGVSSEGRNYGIKLGEIGVDIRKEHIYRIENRIAADGTNTVYLIVDGVEIGNMNTPYSTKDGSLIDDTRNWANGTDIYLDFIGEPTNFLLNNMRLSYLKVSENGHEHSYEFLIIAPTCTEQGYTTYTCACGDSYVGDYVEAAGHTYENGVCTGCGDTTPFDVPSDIDLFVFAGQSNMMGAAVLEPEVDTFTDKALEYKYMPKLRGAENGSFVPAQNPAGEFHYKDLTAAYGDKLNDLSYQSTLTNYSANTYFCPAMRNDTKGFAAQSEADTYPGASLPPYFVTEYADYGHSSVYAHMAKGSVKITHYFTEEMMTRYNALIAQYNAQNGSSYPALTRSNLSGAGDAFDGEYTAMLVDYADFAPHTTVENKCFVWLQGEGDAGGSYIEYKLKMQVLWEHLQELGFTHFFVLRVGYWGNAGIRNVIKAQEDFCAENDNCCIVTRAPSLVPYPGATTDNWWISEPSAEYDDCRDSYVVNSGNHHFNEKAMQIFAERSAKNVHRVLHLGLEPVLEEENIQGLLTEQPDKDETPYTSYVGTEVFRNSLSVSKPSDTWKEQVQSSAGSTDLIAVKSTDSVWLQYVFFKNEAHAVGGFYDAAGNLVAPLYYKQFGFTLDGNTGGVSAFQTPKATNRVSIAAVEAATGREIAFVRFTAWKASAGGHANTEARIYHEEEIHTHSYTSLVTAPTCTEQGYTTYTCATCGDSYVDTYVDAKGHTEAINPAVAETCTTTGLTEGKHCSVCGEVLVAQRAIPATGHSWNDGTVTKAPTEETEGEKVYTCTVCGGTRRESVPVLSHTHSYSGVVTAPACTEQGYTVYTCRCGESYKADYVAARGHVYDSDRDAQCNACGAEREVQKTAVRGKVKNAKDGAKVTLTGAASYETAVSGSEYTFDNAEQGQYDLQIKQAGCLTCTVKDISIGEEDVTLPEVTLVQGDVTGDEKINMQDLRVFLQNFNKVEEKIDEPLTDVNSDRKVNMQDLRVFLQNFNKTAEKDCTISCGA